MGETDDAMVGIELIAMASEKEMVVGAFRFLMATNSCGESGESGQATVYNVS